MFTNPIKISLKLLKLNLKLNTNKIDFKQNIKHLIQHSTNSLLTFEYKRLTKKLIGKSYNTIMFEMKIFSLKLLSYHSRKL